MTTAPATACAACGAFNTSGGRYCSNCGAPLAGTTPWTSSATEDAAEHRQLTIMCCDLVGFTEMTARSDPEDIRDLIRRYQTCVSSEVLRYEGVVAKLVGDGIMAYFGFPQAHENDAERAVLAGLGIVEAARSLRIGSAHASESAVSLRVGIATGPVVIGDMVGSMVSERWAVVGDAANLAARLQSVAPANSVVIGPSTRQIIGGAFDYADLGEHALKGIPAPVRVSQIVGRRAARSRFAAVRGRTTAPLVGRESETALLQQAWKRARAGAGQVVVVRGEAGIGKSRIVQSFGDGLALDQRQRLEYQCSPYHVGSALHPVVTQLEYAAQFAAGDDDAQKVAKLEALLDLPDAERRRWIPYVCAVLGVGPAAGYPKLAVEPSVQRKRTLAALVSVFRNHARRAPQLLVLEDAHWIDPTTLDLLEFLVIEAEALPVLVVVTARPEFEPPWPAGRFVDLHLARLPEDRVREVVSSVCAGALLPPDVMAQIVEKADGVPLFVEELTRAVLEAVLAAQVPASTTRGPTAAVSIPATLQDSLMARLDRLPEEKSVAQLASVIGRRFGYDLLAAVSGVDTQRLEVTLSRLQDAGLIHPRPDAKERTYEFKHALIQDAACQSLLRSVRRSYHERIARALEKDFTAVVAMEPEVVAHHYSEAGRVNEAVSGWLRAGTRALELSAYVEALRHLDRALQLLPGVEEGVTRARLELPLQLARGTTLTAVEGYGTPAVEHAYTRALELGEEVGTDPQKFAALFGLWRVAVTRPDLGRAEALALQLAARAAALGAPELVMIAHGTIALSCFFRGRFAEADAHFREVAERYDPLAHRALAIRAGQDPGLTCMIWSALSLCLTGRPDEARERCTAAVALAREVGHAFSLAYTLRVASVIQHAQGDFSALRATASELLALTAAENFEQLNAAARVFLGMWATEEETPADSLAEITQGLAEYRKGSGLNVPYFLGMLGHAYGRSGDVERGVATLDDALALSAATEERWYEAELLRLKGELLRGGGTEAQSLFAASAEVARAQGATWLADRAAAALAR